MSWLPQIVMFATFISLGGYKFPKSFQQNPAGLYVLFHKYSAISGIYIFAYTLNKNGGASMGKLYSNCLQIAGKRSSEIGWITWLKVNYMYCTF